MPRTLVDHVAAEVRAELARQHLTQGALAEAMGKSEAFVTRRLKDGVPFNLAELEQVAQILKVSVDQLLDRERVL